MLCNVFGIAMQVCIQHFANVSSFLSKKGSYLGRCFSWKFWKQLSLCIAEKNVSCMVSEPCRTCHFWVIQVADIDSYQSWDQFGIENKTLAVKKWDMFHTGTGFCSTTVWLNSSKTPVEAGGPFFGTWALDLRDMMGRKTMSPFPPYVFQLILRICGF